ncbi:MULTISPECIES: hypothetical protein [Halorussus]|uniref:hypothetical protein n=1 Tax=Halorussus TaxID=1070314 RepID=UPI00209C70BD|nr:hypothetical protein [Halorussus vallis]USZ75284.1 hypothetical protein NGM07_17855 [Halorussus vallis]
MTVRSRVRPSRARQRQLVRAMEFGLLGVLLVGLWRRNLGIVVNAAVGLAVTQLPAVLERDYQLTLGPGLTLWITAAVFLHAVGTVPLPGVDASAYQSLWWYDHVTHTLSSSVVAAAGYAAARAVDEYSVDVHLTSGFLFAYLLLFVMAFGVVWELVEFFTGLAAASLGVPRILTQYGLGDTMLDLVFDAAGALVVAAAGTAVLSGVAEQLAGLLEARSDD